MDYDVLMMGRSSIDLYSNDIGTPFEEIGSFAAYVGGSPTNISVGAQRLGLDAVLLTAVGNDPVGDFLLRFLRKEGVETEYIPRKEDRRSSAVILGIEPPDRFPLVYYRENCADRALTIDDARNAPLSEVDAFEFAGTNLSHEPSRSATLFAAERAQQHGAEIVFDIDFRPDQWHDRRAFGVSVRSALQHVDVLLGTQDEIKAAMLASEDQIDLEHSQVSDAEVRGDLDTAIEGLLGLGPEVLVEKRGEEGACIHHPDGTHKEVPGFPVDIHNILGAGDAFAAGFLHGRVNGRGWYESARLGNACGAIVVTEHGCANFMPTYDEVMAFVDERGGL
jgi:5-dehydro-2-deoxygluconokinase